MQKAELLSRVSEGAQRGEVSQEELLAAYQSGLSAQSDKILSQKVSLSEIFYYLGGMIVFLGIVISVSQNYSRDLTSQLWLTLGVMIVTAVVGWGLILQRPTEHLGSAFFFISALLGPVAGFLVTRSLGYDFGSSGVQSVVSLILLSWFLLHFIVLRKTLFVIFSIIFGTWLLYSLIGLTMGSDELLYHGEVFFEYRVLILSVIWLYLGYVFSRGQRTAVSGFLYGFGIVVFLGAALALGGWEPRQNLGWEIAFPFLVFGAISLSLKIHSRAFLTFGTLYLMAYIIKITSEYFSDGVGWPLALMFAGILLMAVGWVYLYVGKKYGLRKSLPHTQNTPDQAAGDLQK